MKKLLIGAWLISVASLSWASCTTSSFTMNGRTVYCTTCCYGSNCSTNCF